MTNKELIKIAYRIWQDINKSNLNNAWYPLEEHEKECQKLEQENKLLKSKNSERALVKALCKIESLEQQNKNLKIQVKALERNRNVDNCVYENLRKENKELKEQIDLIYLKHMRK